MIVVDTNTMVYLLVGGPSGPDAVRLLERDPLWAAPGILLSELRNVLVGFVRRDALSPEHAEVICADAAEVLGDRLFTVPSSNVLDTALACGLSAYDAEFVVLARQFDVPLVTADREILGSATDVAVSLVDLS
ncbi:MAG: type II toxin-antitoxin system VapC family toxin [Chloroflexota bacterium]|nr:type II toxin-antitoxin system VapC family toxin [Chloroflexota bacterium]